MTAIVYTEAPQATDISIDFLTLGILI